MYRPDVPENGVAADKEEIKGRYTHAIFHQAEINMHFHVFEMHNLRGLFRLVAERKHLDWEILELRDRFPGINRNGILVVVRVGKKRADALKSLVNRRWARLKKTSVVSRTARPVTDADELRRLHLKGG